MKKVYSSFCALFAIILCTFTVLPANAATTTPSFFDQFSQTVNKHIDTNNNRIDLTKEQIEAFVNAHQEQIVQEQLASPDTIDQVSDDLWQMVDTANSKLTNEGFRIQEDGHLIPRRSPRSANFKLEWFWWGTRRTFYTDQDARNFAYDMDSAARIATVTGLSSFIFPGMGIITGINSAYANGMAAAVRQAADQPGNGVVLDTRFTLSYSARPR